MAGPSGRLIYEGYGNFDIRQNCMDKRENKMGGKIKLGHVAGGTGITPCY